MASLQITRRTFVGAGSILAVGGGVSSASAQSLSRFAGRTAGSGTFDHSGFDALLERRARLMAWSGSTTPAGNDQWRIEML